MPVDRKIDVKDALTLIMFVAILVLLMIASARGLTPLAVVSSWSMEPTIHVGDLIIIAPRGRLMPGEIVIYQSDNKLIVHRLLRFEGKHLITKGDANRYADFPVSPNQVRGKVALVIPYLGIIKLAVEKTLRFLFPRR